MQPTTRVLMTDIDGVLHEARKALLVGDVIRLPAELKRKVAQHGLFCHTETLAAVLADFQDVALVIHSDWRHFVELEQLREFLGPLGPYLAGVTQGVGRHPSIRQFVHEHRIQHFRILDDAVREFQHPCPELIACHPMLGAADPDVLSSVRDWLTATQKAE